MYFTEKSRKKALFVDEPENSLSPKQIELMKFIEDSARF